MKQGILAACLLIAACGVAPPATPTTTSESLGAPVASTTVQPAQPAADATSVLAAPTATLPTPGTRGPEPTVATTTGELAVYSFPNAPAPVEHLPATTILGTPTVVRVIQSPDDGWVLVSLPGRPNGRTGWIRAQDVEMSTVTTSILIDLSSRHMEVWRDGVLTVSTPVAIGSATSPTPTGVFFVTDAIDMTANPGAWGPYAFGLSARSDVITEFNGGDGIIGIHGTNRPSSIGEARSLGCIRVPNEIVLEMAGYVELGALVEIRS